MLAGDTDARHSGYAIPLGLKVSSPTCPPTVPPNSTWWAEAVEGGKQVQAGAAPVAGL